MEEKKKISPIAKFPKSLINELEQAAEKSGYFITVSYYKDNEKREMHHHTNFKDYKRGDLVPTLEHIISEVETKHIKPEDSKYAWK